MAPQVSSIDPVIQDNVRGRHSGASRMARQLKIAHPEWSETQIAKFLGCDKALAHRAVVSLREMRDKTKRQLEEYQATKADKFDAMQMRIYKSVTDEDIAKAPLLPRVTSLAILEDKARLIRGQATSVNVVVLLDAVESIKQMRRGTPAPQDVAIEASPPALSAQEQSSDE